MSIAVDIEKWSNAQLQGTAMLGSVSENISDRKLAIECINEIQRRKVSASIHKPSSTQQPKDES